MDLFKLIPNTKDIQKGDIIIIKSTTEYSEMDDEITELVEKFAEEPLTVISVSKEPNEFGEYTISAMHSELGSCTFTEHEIHTVIRTCE